MLFTQIYVFICLNPYVFVYTVFNVHVSRCRPVLANTHTRNRSKLEIMFPYIETDLHKVMVNNRI